MNIQALFCKECGDKIYSRAVHDYRTCTCGNISIDGGTSFLKVSYKRIPNYLHTAVKLNVTEKELYDDWINDTDKYGLIHPTTPYKKERKRGTDRRKARK